MLLLVLRLDFSTSLLKIRGDCRSISLVRAPQRSDKKLAHLLGRICRACCTILRRLSDPHRPCSVLRLAADGPWGVVSCWCTAGDKPCAKGTSGEPCICTDSRAFPLEFTRSPLFILQMADDAPTWRIGSSGSMDGKTTNSTWTTTCMAPVPLMEPGCCLRRRCRFINSSLCCHTCECAKRGVNVTV